MGSDKIFVRLLVTAGAHNLLVEVRENRISCCHTTTTLYTFSELIIQAQAKVKK